MRKKYQWLNANVILPLMQENGSLEDSAIFEIDLLKKETNLVIDNIALYLQGDQELRWQIKTEQLYLHFENNPLLGLANKKALSWQASYGLVYNLGENLKVEVNGGVNSSTSYDKSFSGITYQKKRPFSSLGEHSRLEVGMGSYNNTYRVENHKTSQSMFGFQLKITL